MKTANGQIKSLMAEGFYLVKYNGVVTAAKFDGYWFTLCGLPLKKRESQLDRVIRILR